MIDSLPQDVVGIIFSKLNYSQIATASRVCKKWRRWTMKILHTQHPFASLCRPNIHNLGELCEKIRKSTWRCQDITDNRRQPWRYGMPPIRSCSLSVLTPNRIMVGTSWTEVFIFDVHNFTDTTKPIATFNTGHDGTWGLAKLQDHLVFGCCAGGSIFQYDSNQNALSTFYDFSVNSTMLSIAALDEWTFVTGGYGNKFCFFDIRQRPRPIKKLETYSKISDIKKLSSTLLVYNAINSFGVIDFRQFSNVLSKNGDYVNAVQPVNERTFLASKCGLIELWDVGENHAEKSSFVCPSPTALMPLNDHALIMGNGLGELFCFDMQLHENKHIFKNLNDPNRKSYVSRIHFIERLNSTQFLAGQDLCAGGLHLWNVPVD